MNAVQQFPPDRIPSYIRRFILLLAFTMTRYLTDHVPINRCHL